MIDNYEKFSSIDDLYRRIEPAMKTKIDELKRKKIINVSPKDIWNFCAMYCWKNKSDLRIYEMVSDILNIDELKLLLFIKKNNTININDKDELNDR